MLMSGNKIKVAKFNHFYAGFYRIEKKKVAPMVTVRAQKPRC